MSYSYKIVECIYGREISLVYLNVQHAQSKHAGDEGLYEITSLLKRNCAMIFLIKDTT